MAELNQLVCLYQVDSDFKGFLRKLCRICFPDYIKDAEMPKVRFLRVIRFTVFPVKSSR